MRYFYFFATLVILGLAWACNPEDDFITDQGAQLEFSLDTLRFDTVFTEIGSATRILKVYNPHDQSIKIDKIMIREGASSVFRINIDGIPTAEASDVEIAANDSLYIFGEVTVNPDQDFSISPFVIEDAIMFLTNGNEQSVLLEAWGQNANYIPSRFSKGETNVFSCDFGEWVWDDPRPYVIFGLLVIDECTLRMPPGTQVYVHGGLESTFVEDSVGNPVKVFFNDGRLIVGPQASLVIEGTVEEPVTVQGDRLEEDFGDVAGQWFGILLSPGSQGNRIENAQIKNSIFGVAADSATELSLKNTQIFHTSSSAVIGIHAEIKAQNSLFFDNGASSVRLIYGGNYNFDYCSLGSYGVDASALSVSNALCLDQLCSRYRANNLNVQFRNSIIFGSRRDEIVLASVPEADFNYGFENCIVKVDELDDEGEFVDFFDQCVNCINGERDAALFADIDENDYRLDTLSIAEGMAIPLSNILLDLDGQNRDPNMPDIGCYEYIIE
ncbi:MAG: hypothetical protein AAFP19_02850 [Bacteroidota bacterium]